jgi:hypothetical protein
MSSKTVFDYRYCSKEHRQNKCTVLEWIRAGFRFPGKVRP